MSKSVHIQLYNVPETLTPGQPIECTVDGQPHDAHYIGPGEWDRVIVVEVSNLRMRSDGKLVPDMFESFTDEFVVCSGGAWNGYSGAQYEAEL